jgi:hypothetical protein
MINVYIDGDEVTFCIAGMEDLHYRKGTLTQSAVKVASYNTNSMPEAHQLFSDQLESVELDGSVDEGWD